MQRYFLIIFIIFGYSQIVLANNGPLANRTPEVPPTPTRAVAPPTDKQIAAEKTAVAAVSPAETAEMASGDGQGYTDIEAQISTQCKSLLPYEQSVSPASPMGSHLGKMLAACNAVEGFSGTQSLCIKSQMVSSKACLESEVLNNANIGIQLLGSVGSMAIQDSCSAIAKAMDISKNAFSLYTVACNTARYTCSSKCGAAVGKMKALESTVHAAQKIIVGQKCTIADVSEQRKSEIETERAMQANLGSGIRLAQLISTAIAECQSFIDATATPALSAIVQQTTRDLTTVDRKSVAGKVKTCEVDFGKMVASAGASGLSLLASYAQAKKCEQQTAAAQAATSLDCNDPKNKNIPDCICEKSPRSVGCANTLAKSSGSLNAAGSGSSIAQASVPKIGERSLASETPLGKDPAAAAGVKSAASSSSVGGAQAGAPVGGGGGGGGAGGLGSDGRGSGGKETPTFGRGSRFNTNVTAGYDGGGSGGFRRGGFSSEAEAKLAYDNYKKTMDPVKVAAQAWAKEVSPQNGRSNFEKIKSRYNDNRRTLIGK